MKVGVSWIGIAAILAVSASCSMLLLPGGRETQHFSIRGDIPENRIEAIYDILSKKIFIPTGTGEKIPVRIDRRLSRAGLEGKAYHDHISLASYTDNTFIHELAHYLWEIRGWQLRPWLRAERSRLRSAHPLIKEEFLNHYLIYEVIIPRVEELLQDISQ